MSFLSKLGLRNWFKKTKQTAAVRAHLNKPLSIESLENRITPSVTAVAGHGTGLVLYITTTDLPDTLHVDLTGTILTVSGVIGNGAPFGGTNKGGVYTLDFSKGGATNFGGIKTEQLLSSDILIVDTGLDFSSIPAQFLPDANNVQVEFYGNKKSDVNNEFDNGNNALTLTGIISSQNDDIVYQQWVSITGNSSDGAPTTSIANFSTLPLLTLNNYNVKEGQYFNIFDYDHRTGSNRPIDINGGPIEFLATGSGSIQIDTELQLKTDLRLGNNNSSSIVNIISDAIASQSIPAGGITGIDNPSTSFSSIVGTNSLYITTAGSVSVNGINLDGNLRVYNTGKFEASRDLNSTGVSVASIDFNEIQNANASANFNKNVDVGSDFKIYSFGAPVGNSSSISIGTNASLYIPDKTTPYTLTVGGNFVADSSVQLILDRSVFPFTDIPINPIVTNGIYNVNFFADKSLINGSATLKNTGNVSIGVPGRIATVAPFNPATFTVGGSIDGSKAKRADTVTYGTTSIFADVSAGTYIKINGNLIASTSDTSGVKTFNISAAKGNLEIVGDVELNTSPSGNSGSNLTMSAGTAFNGNIPDAQQAFGTLNNIIIGGVDGFGRTLTINQCAGFLSSGTVKLTNLKLNDNKLNSNNGAGFYVFQGNIGTSLTSSGVNLFTGKGLYGIDFRGTENYFEGTSQFLNFGRVVFGASSASTFHFNSGANFEADKDANGAIMAPSLCGGGRITGNTGSIVLNGATLTPGNYTIVDANNKVKTVSNGVLTFEKLPLNLKEKYSSSPPDDVKGVYYVDFSGVIPGINQDQINTSNLIVDGEYILYPVFRTLDIPIGTKFVIVNQTSPLGIFGYFSGLTDPISNLYSTLYEGATFYASGAKYSITYQGGDGNDVVITYKGISDVGPETIVYVNENNVLNVLGKDGSSDVTLQNSLSVTGSLQLTIDDPTFGLTGFAYGTKVINNMITIPVGLATTIGRNELQGINVVQNGGNDKLNLVNLSFQNVVLYDQGHPFNSNLDFITIDPDPSDPNSTGSGYTTAPDVIISAPDDPSVNNPIQATAIAVLGTGQSSGQVVSYIVTNSGFGYISAPTVTLQGGGFTTAAVPKLTFKQNPNLYTTNGQDLLLNGVKATSIYTNPNLENISFSFNGGPSAYPSNDIDVLNLVGTNRNIETGKDSNQSTVTVSGYDIIRFDNSVIQADDVSTGFLAVQGSLYSANQGVNSLVIRGNVSIDKGNLSFGTLNRSDISNVNTNDTTKMFVTNFVPLTPGNLTFTGDMFLGDDVNLVFGNGTSSTNFQFQNISGTSGGNKSNISFNVNSNTQVYNGQNLDDNVPQKFLISNIFGGNITVNGSIGSDIGNIEFINASNSNFNGIVDAAKISIIKTDGNIIFNKQVGTINEPVDIEITEISVGNSFIFNDNLFAGSISSTAESTALTRGYNLKFLGSVTNVKNNVILNTSGSIILGDSNDLLTFSSGIVIDLSTYPSSSIVTQIFFFGSISSNGYKVTFIPSITLTGDSSISSVGSLISAPIILNDVFTKSFSLTLDAGNFLGSTIELGQLRDVGGKLIVNSSGGLTIKKVGDFPQPSDPSSSPEIFGSVIINDTIGDVIFSGPVLVNEIITTRKNYNVFFNGKDTVNNYSYKTYVNSVPVYRWFYLITGSNPTVFQNQGNVTFGIHGSNPQKDMDLFIFNGGVSTSTITGITNLASRLYSVNKTINLGNTVTTDSSFINTYFSSQVFNNLSGPTFLNPQIAQTLQSPSSPDQAIGPQFNDNEIINTNILKAFGFKSNQLTSIGSLAPPLEGFPRPYGDLPYPSNTGDVLIASVINDSYYLHINAGGQGIYGPTVGGDVTIGSYIGGSSDDRLGFYRGNNFSVVNSFSANNLYLGSIANGEPSFSNVANIDLSILSAPLSFLSSPSLPAEVDLTGAVTFQGNFTIKKNFIVTSDVNNLLILGSNNSLIADNIITNSGVLQLGNQFSNSSSSVFNVSNNLNVQGPSVRRIGGSFIAATTKVLDFGPGPITLVANTVLTTSGIGKTTLGQVTNNQFNLIVNGTAELQKFADDFSLAPYPSLTNPSSYIPTNNFVGAGVGGSQNNGNVTFNGIVKVQDYSLFTLNKPVVVNNSTQIGGFSNITGNGISAIGFTRQPDVVVSGGGGSGAVVNALLGISINGFTGTVIGNKVTFNNSSKGSQGIATLLPDSTGNGTPVTLEQPIVPYVLNPFTGGPNPPNYLTPTQNVNNFIKATGTVVVAGGFITSFTIDSDGLNGQGYTDLTNLQFLAAGIYTPVGNTIVGGIKDLILQYPGAGYTSVPTISILNTSSGIVSNGANSGIGFYGTNGAAPLSAINNGVTPNVIVNTSISPATIATGNVINIPTTTTLRKQGTGSVFLNTDSSANTAGLATTIENGNFFFENAKINAATVTNVTGNGLLGGTNGTLGAVNVLPRGQLSPGNLTNPIGLLNLQGNLSVQSTYKVDIRSVAFNLFDQVKVTGSVSLAKNNINGILDVAFTPDADVISGNTFGIISNDGTDTVTGKFKTPAGIVLNQGDSFTVNMPNGTDIATFQISYTGNIATNGTASLTGGNDVVIQITGIQSISSAVAAKSKNLNKFFAVSTDSGGGPIVKISFADGSGFSFFAYDTSFTGGVRTAIGDVNGDGNPDLITAAGAGGGPHVIIWTITAGVPYATVQSGFFAFEPGFTGGITLATGNINGDVSSSNNALDDIIVGAGAGGGPRVKAFAGNANFAAINNQSQLVDFFAYAPEFNLGVNVAAGDRTGDGKDEIITGAAQGGGPHVQVWQISNGTANSIQSFFAFDPSYLCGVFVGSGDLDGDSLADIYTGTGSGPIGSVGIYFGNGAVSRLEPFGSGFTGGVRVGAALGGLNSPPNVPYLLTAAGPGGGPQVSLFDSNLNIVDAFFAFQENFTGGVLASTTVNT